jgi:predicted enzyme related to lactoylglutathione lyase
MNAENKIDYIEIPAKDPAAAQEFFSALFGWKFEDYGPDYCSYSDGRLAGGFFRSELRASAEEGSALVVIYRSDLAAAVSRVTELGGTVTKDIFSFPGGSRFHFRDPNDNEFAVWSEK